MYLEKTLNSKRYMQASVHSSIILGQENNPNVHQQMSGLRRYGTSIRWNITESKKEWNNVTCRNMDGPRDHLMKWNKSKTNNWYYSYVESKNNTNELILKHKYIHRHRKQTYGYQRVRREVRSDKLGVWD